MLDDKKLDLDVDTEETEQEDIEEEAQEETPEAETEEDETEAEESNSSVDFAAVKKESLAKVGQYGHEDVDDWKEEAARLHGKMEKEIAQIEKKSATSDLTWGGQPAFMAEPAEFKKAIASLKTRYEGVELAEKLEEIYADREVYLEKKASFAATLEKATSLQAKAWDDDWKAVSKAMKEAMGDSAYRKYETELADAIQKELEDDLDLQASLYAGGRTKMLKFAFNTFLSSGIAKKAAQVKDPTSKEPQEKVPTGVGRIGSGVKQAGPKRYTPESVKKMSNAEFLKNEKAILKSLSR
jgi:hypothetical protein